MTGDVLSGGVVVALAAALWLAYLVPTWLRRREYMSTERNAVRLQQTLRILAETAEVPQQVRVEATAKEVAVQQRILRKEEERMLAEVQARTAAEVALRRAEAEAAAVAAASVAAAAASTSAASVARVAMVAAATTGVPRAAGLAAQPVIDAVVQDARRRARRIRRARAIASLFLLGAIAVVAFGIAEAVAGGALVLMAAGGILAATSLVVLGRLARAGRVRVIVPSVAAPVVDQGLFDHADHVEPHAETPSTWTPHPLPKPLYQRRGTIAASAMASVDAATELRRAAARQDLERRAAELAPEQSPEVTPLRPVVAPAAAPAASAGQVPSVPPEGGRFARMGMLDDLAPDAIDLDAVLRRRRAAG